MKAEITPSASQSPVLVWQREGDRIRIRITPMTEAFWPLRYLCRFIGVLVYLNPLGLMTWASRAWCRAIGKRLPYTLDFPARRHCEVEVDDRRVILRHQYGENSWERAEVRDVVIAPMLCTFDGAGANFSKAVGLVISDGSTHPLGTTNLYYKQLVWLRDAVRLALDMPALPAPPRPPWYLVQ